MENENFIKASVFLLRQAHRLEQNFMIWGLYYESLWIWNLLKNDKFCSKLASFGFLKNTTLDKHNSLLRILYITDP